MRELQRSAVHASPVAGRSLLRGIIVATVAALLMTLTGAFGTDMLPLGQRLLYWLVIMEAGALIGIGVSEAFERWGALQHRPWIEGALTSICIAAPLTLLVLGTGIVFFGATRPPGLHYFYLFAMVLAVTAAITAVNYAIAGGAPAAAAGPQPASAQAATASADADTAPPRPRLAERLPPHLRDAPIHAVAAEDHYLRVHTAAGSDLILLRLSDAIVELEGVAGARTHRSWWVSREAVQHADRHDGRGTLTLPGDVVAPVSRSHYPALRDAGWFD
jgi:hypothetical protein